MLAYLFPLLLSARECLEYPGYTYCTGCERSEQVEIFVGGVSFGCACNYFRFFADTGSGCVALSRANICEKGLCNCNTAAGLAANFLGTACDCDESRNFQNADPTGLSLQCQCVLPRFVPLGTSCVCNGALGFKTSASGCSCDWSQGYVELPGQVCSQCAGQYAAPGRKACVEQCPANSYVGSGSRCMCSAGKYLQETADGVGKCVDACASGYRDMDAMECKESCKFSIPVDPATPGGMKTCVAEEKCNLYAALLGGSSFLCSSKKCDVAGYRFRNGKQCMAECPSLLYKVDAAAGELVCQESCVPTTVNASVSQTQAMCTQCPEGKFLIVRKDQTTGAEIGTLDDCSPQCPTGAPVADTTNRRCIVLSACKQLYYNVNGTHYCGSTCPATQLMNWNSTGCVTACASIEYRFGGQCVRDCPSGLFKQVEGSIRTCVEQCAVNYIEETMTCVSPCPSGFYIQGVICVKQCYSGCSAAGNASSDIANRTCKCSSSQDEFDDEPKKNEVGAIVGGIIGGMLGVAGIGTLLFLYLRKLAQQSVHAVSDVGPRAKSGIADRVV